MTAAFWGRVRDALAVPELPDRTVNRYNSVDAWESISTVYQEHLLLDARETPRWLKWFFVFAVPLLVSVISVLLRQCLQAFNRVQLSKVLEALDRRFESNQGFAVASCVGCIAASSLIAVSLAMLLSVKLGNKSTGRGLTAVVAHLNGIHMPQWGEWTNVGVKIITTFLVVSSGVPLGQYGMIAEIGAMVGAAVLSRNAVSVSIPFLSHFRNPRDARLIVNIGLAAGVTAAFQSPIGGLLVVLELLTSKFPVKFAAYVFSGCVFCAFCVQVMNTYFDGFQPRDRHGQPETRLDPTNEQRQVVLNYALAAPAVIIAVLCSAVGTVFTRLTVLLARLHTSKPLTAWGVAKICVAAMLYGSVHIVVSFAFGGTHCSPFATSSLDDARDGVIANTVSLGTTTALFCKNRTTIHDFYDSTKYDVNPYASLALTFPEAAFRLLIQREVQMNTNAVIVFALIQLVGSIYFTSLTRALNGDTLLPNAALGACIGRMVFRAQALVGLDANWVNGGEYALLGAAAMLSTVNRLTFSLVFLMVDVSGDVRHVAFVMLSVTVARLVAQHVFRFPSLEHSLLDIEAIPLLDFADEVATRDDLTLHRFQTPGLEVLRPDESVSHLIDLLTRTTHAAFPVVSRRGRKLVGVVHRNTIELLLWRYTSIPPRHLCCDINVAQADSDRSEATGQTSVRWKPAHVSQRMPGVSFMNPLDPKSAHRTATPTSPADMKRPMDEISSPVEEDHESQPPRVEGFDEYLQLQELDDWITVRKQTGVFRVDEDGTLWHRMPSLSEAILETDARVLRQRVNLMRYADRSPFTVRLATSAGRAYHMFNVLGARHLVILDYAGHPRGILTRIDLLRHAFEEKRLQEHAHDEQEAQVPSSSDSEPSPVAAAVARTFPTPPDLDERHTDFRESAGAGSGPVLVKVYPEAAKRFEDRAPKTRSRLKKTPSVADASGDDASGAVVVYVSHRKPQWAGNAFGSVDHVSSPGARAVPQLDAAALLIPTSDATTLRRALFLPRGTVPLPPATRDHQANGSDRRSNTSFNLSFARPTAAGAGGPSRKGHVGEADAVRRTMEEAPASRTHSFATRGGHRQAQEV